MSINKRILAAFACSLLLLTGCGNSSDQSTDKNTAEISEDSTKEETLKAINDAKKIVIKKDLITFDNNYTIYADNQEVAELHGRVVKGFVGDVFSIKTLGGETIASEKQQKRYGVKFSRSAKVSMPDGSTHYIAEEKIKDMAKIGYRTHFFDGDDNELGRTRKVISITNDNKIYNKDGDVAYEVDGKISLSGKYVIDVKDTSKISPIEAIFFTCIQHEIENAK